MEDQGNVRESAQDFAKKPLLPPTRPLETCEKVSNAQSRISTELDSRAMKDQGYVGESAQDSAKKPLVPLTRPLEMCEKVSNVPSTLDMTIEKETNSILEGSKNSPMRNSVHPSKIENSSYIDKGSEDRKLKLESARKIKGSTIPITPSGSHGGIQENTLPKSTLSTVDDSTESSDVKKRRYSNSLGEPLDLPQISRDTEDGSRMMNSPSLNQPLGLDKKVEHQCTRKEEHLEHMEEMVSLNNGTLCISEDSNQTFSDVSCETSVKECETKESSKNRQLIGICKGSTPLVSQSPMRVKQKSITSFFKCIH